jgi:quinol monooxygenase YgiN
MSELVGIVRFKFHPGKVEDFKRLTQEAMEIVRTQDTGTLAYATYFNADESEAIVIERYKDSQALLDHGQHLAPLMEPIVATGECHGELLGEVSDEIRANLGEGGPVQLFLPYVSL